MITRRAILGLFASATVPSKLLAQSIEATNSKAADQLATLQDRLPDNPRVINLKALGREPGKQGGRVRTLVGRAKDIRYVPIFSYSRLVGYNQQLEFVPDILESYTVEEGRIFTFTLRAGHRWSDGSELTSEDFRYYWEDFLLNTEMLPSGPPARLKVDGVVAKFEVLDRLTIRYSWDVPMPRFLSMLAAPIPQTLALPSAYMRQFHGDYQSAAILQPLVEKYRVDTWIRLHRKMSRQNRPENPDLPTLEAWRPRTLPPAEQFIFERNPYFHRIDENGVQLPYIDKLVLNVSSAGLISAKVATGESDLQATGLGLPDYTLMKEAESRFPIKVSLWRQTRGSSVALFPNLNCKDDIWRGLFQDVRMRRALSLAINRREINQVICYGLARESADTILPESPLYKPGYSTAWANYNPDQANALLDEIGLSERGANGIRILSDGSQANITIESAGESTLETDVLELITDHYRQVGIALFIRNSQRDIFRSRVVGGNVMMSAWQGLDNGMPSADMPPLQLAPTTNDQLQWPVWGLHYLSGQKQGRAVDMPKVAELEQLLDGWLHTTTSEQRFKIWQKMLDIHADQVYSIGTVNGMLHPVVKSDRLQNVPDDGLYGFEPMSYLGVYMPDTFWYQDKG